MADPGFRVLQDKTAMLRVVTEQLTDACVADVAKVIDSDVKSTIAAGTDPYGKPWPAKKDGTPFRFVSAADVVTGSIGSTIITRIKTRHVVLHHFGYARGHVERQILPQNGKVPDRMARAIKAAIVRRATQVLEGGAR